MDVSEPNNWPRIEYMIESGQFDAKELMGTSVTENETKQSMLELRELGYISEPHAAVAYRGLTQNISDNEYGIFLGTAHPAKFKESVDSILSVDLPLPKELADCASKENLSVEMDFDFEQLKVFLTGKN